MDLLKLNHNYSLAVEPVGNKVRLVIYRGEVEKVCRLEKVKDLEEFMESNESQLFKGRLQLHKTIAGIDVFIKGKPAGTLITADLLQQLKKQRNTLTIPIFTNDEN